LNRLSDVIAGARRSRTTPTRRTTTTRRTLETHEKLKREKGGKRERTLHTRKNLGQKDNDELLLHSPTAA